MRAESPWAHMGAWGPERHEPRPVPGTTTCCMKWRGRRRNAAASFARRARLARNPARKAELQSEVQSGAGRQTQQGVRGASSPFPSAASPKRVPPSCHCSLPSVEAVIDAYRKVKTDRLSGKERQVVGTGHTRRNACVERGPKEHRWQQFAVPALNCGKQTRKSSRVCGAYDT